VESDSDGYSEDKGEEVLEEKEQHEEEP